MTGNVSKFMNLKLKEMGTIYFGNNGKLKVLGSDNIFLNLNFTIKKVLYVEHLQFNFLRISQLYDSQYKVEFQSNKYFVKSIKESNLTLLGNTINLFSPSSSLTYLIAHKEEI